MRVFFNNRDVLFLIALGIGYLVLYFARREEKWLEKAGYLVAGSIIVITALYFLASFFIRSKLFYRDLQCRKELLMQEHKMYKEGAFRGREHGVPSQP